LIDIDGTGEIANASLCETGTSWCQQKLCDPSSRAHVANGSPKQLSVASGSIPTQHVTSSVAVIYKCFFGRNSVVVWLLQCRHISCSHSALSEFVHFRRIEVLSFRSCVGRSLVMQVEQLSVTTYRCFLLSLEVCVRILELDWDLTTCSLGRHVKTFERKSLCLPLSATSCVTPERYIREDRRVLPDVRLGVAAFRKVSRLRPLVFLMILVLI
jgi:hypothetical protein